VGKGYSQLERREYFVSAADSVTRLKKWVGIFFVIKVVSRRKIADKATTEDSYDMSSLASSKTVEIAKGIRSHWVVENSLYYVVDATFAQDSSRVYKENAGEKFGIIRKLAMNLLRGAQAKA